MCAVIFYRVTDLNNSVLIMYCRRNSLHGVTEMSGISHPLPEELFAALVQKLYYYCSTTAFLFLAITDDFILSYQVFDARDASHFEQLISMFLKSTMWIFS